MSRSGSRRVRAFFTELKRRRVVRVAVIYVVAAFGGLQGADVLVPALELPAWTMTMLVVIALAGFPVALGLAWAFDIVPAGRVPAPPPAGTVPEEATSTQPGPSAPATALPGTTTDGAGRGATDDGSGTVEPSVAVVPFLNLSPDPENEYFADGITEDVILHLSKIHALKVISRTSVMPFKKRGQSLREIGEKLGATTLVDGSVRRDGDRVRVVAQLVDAATDRHLWAETYDRELTDIFAIQTDVAFQIASALKAELSPDEQTRIRQEPTDDLRAYQLYLKGRHWFIHYTAPALRRAIEYFDRAVAVDPDYALAYAATGMAYAELAEDGAMPPDIARRRATDAAARALRLDPTLSEAHCITAHLKSLWEFDWSGAEAGFRRAIELCPSSADAYDLFGRLCAALERYDEALTLQRRAQELDPLAHRIDVASTLLRAGRYEEAETEALRAVEFDPDHDRARATLGWACFQQGRHHEGLAELERAVALAPGGTQWTAQLGQAHATAGHAEAAREILQKLETRAKTDYVAPYHLAYIYTGLGEQEHAIGLLEQAFEERAGAIHGIKGSFLFAPLKEHPRFQALLAKMNLA
jgi:TolB-like protein/Tfp pilus assembly protein PilF